MSRRGSRCSVAQMSVQPADTGREQSRVHDGPMWSRGQVVVHQEVWAGRLWAARPLFVVEDTEERALLWIPQGTRRKVPITPPHRADPSDVHTRTIENLDHRDWLEFEEIVRRGIFDQPLADQVMSEALSVIDDLERRRSPFDSDWPSWRPDHAWGLPYLIDGWDVVHK